MHKTKIILSGGGTGGHIFPAISIALKLKKMIPGAEILFVGAKGKMEMEKVPQAGFPIIGLPVSGFHRRLTVKNLSFIFRLMASMVKASTIIRNFKPDLVVGTGGFASGPVLRAASRKGIPCLLQEQNAFPGVTNRMLAKKVQTICVAHEGLEKYFPKEKIILTGNPVRENIIDNTTSREKALEFFGLGDDKPVIFVFGGSQGARTINHSIIGGLENLAEENLSVLWQTGKEFFPTAQKAAEGLKGDNIKVFDFIQRMDFAYQLADVIISRAGAIAISELCLVGKPVILVPFPHAAGDHQVKNAKALAESKAALMVFDHEAEKDLVSSVISLFKDKTLMEELSRNISGMAKPDATQKIADEAVKLIKYKSW